LCIGEHGAPLITNLIQRRFEYVHIRQRLVDQMINPCLFHHHPGFYFRQGKSGHQDNRDILQD
jgi:hypothetical protein